MSVRADSSPFKFSVFASLSTSTSSSSVSPLSSVLSVHVFDAKNDANVKVTLPHFNNIDVLEGEVTELSHTCSEEIETISFVCPDGQVKEEQCNGTSGVFHLLCRSDISTNCLTLSGGWLFNCHKFVYRFAFSVVFFLLKIYPRPFLQKIYNFMFYFL